MFYLYVNESPHKKNEDLEKWLGLRIYVLDWTKHVNAIVEK